MNEAQVNAMLQAIAAQRNAALDDVVRAAARIAELEAKIKELESPKE